MKKYLYLKRNNMCIKRLFCKHDYEFLENIYGDEINYLNCRSLWKCKKCGKIKKSNKLYYGENEHSF